MPEQQQQQQQQKKKKKKKKLFNTGPGKRCIRQHCEIFQTVVDLDIVVLDTVHASQALQFWILHTTLF